MACVRDVFYVPPKTTSQKRLRRPLSGPVNQWVEWMEWSLYAWSGALLNLHLRRHRRGCNWSYETLSWCLHCKQGSFPVFSPARDGSSRALHEWLHIPRNESCKVAHNKHGWMSIWWSRVKWSISMWATSWKSKARAQIMSNSSAKNRFISFWWITVKCQLFYNKIAVARVYLDVCFLGFTSFWVRPSLVFWKEFWRTKLPVLKFQVSRPDTFEISSHHWVPSQGAPKQFINIDNDYRTSIDSLTQFKAYESGSKACKHPSLQDPREVSGLWTFRLQWSSCQHDRWDAPEEHAFVRSSNCETAQNANVSCEGFSEEFSAEATARHWQRSCGTQNTVTWGSLSHSVTFSASSKKEGVAIHISESSWFERCSQRSSHVRFMYEWLKLQHVAGRGVRTEQTQCLAPNMQNNL